MPLTFPYLATPGIPPPDQPTKPEFWHKPQSTEANRGGLDPCLDLPTTKRRRLNENHSPTPYEAYTLQEQQPWLPQTQLSSGQDNLGDHLQPYLRQPNSGHDQQPRTYLTQQDYDLNRKYHEVLPSYNWNADPQLQQQYAGSNSYYQFETRPFSENAIDVQEWDLARLHEGLQTSHHPDHEKASPMTSFQIALSDYSLITQNAVQNSTQALDCWDFHPTQDNVQKTPRSYNSGNETLYQHSLQIEPRKKSEDTKAFDLHSPVLGDEIQSPQQSTLKHQCSLSGILNRQQSRASGPECDLRQDSLKNPSQSRVSRSPIDGTILQVQSRTYNQDAEGGGYASAAAEVCYGMVSPEFLLISRSLTPI